MGERERRSVQRFDYKVWNDTGVKVPLLEETFKMTDPKLAKVSGELSGLVFQVEEILDDLHVVNDLGLEVLRGHLDELKVLRVNIV